MEGIIGESDKQTAITEPREISAPSVIEPSHQEVTQEEIKEEQTPPQNTPEKRRPGRPRKSESDQKIEEIRATFIVDSSQVRKMKYISLVEGKLLKDVLAAALNDYIASWEEENGRIRLPKTK